MVDTCAVVLWGVNSAPCCQTAELVMGLLVIRSTGLEIETAQTRPSPPRTERRHGPRRNKMASYNIAALEEGKGLQRGLPTS